MKDPIVRPWNLLWMIPVLALSAFFENPMTSLGFVLALSFVTSRMFPIIEVPQEEEKK